MSIRTYVKVKNRRRKRAREREKIEIHRVDIRPMKGWGGWMEKKRKIERHRERVIALC